MAVSLSNRLSTLQGVITFAQLLTARQSIEPRVGLEAYFFDRRSGRWRAPPSGLSRSIRMTVLGTKALAMPKVELVAYKRMLDPDVDRLDLAELV